MKVWVRLGEGWRFEESVVLVEGEEGIDGGAECGIAGAGAAEKGGALGGGAAFEGCEENLPFGGGTMHGGRVGVRV